MVISLFLLDLAGKGRPCQRAGLLIIHTRPVFGGYAGTVNSHKPADLIGDLPTFAHLRKAVQECEGCDLFRHATQAVPGEGPAKARLLFVGEQPGNEEDLEGRPFVGPAGRILARALADAGIPREQSYVTNAVKHFKFEERGKRRIHKKPSAAEVRACGPWLEAEIGLVKPEIIVCLGATAAQALLGREYRLTKERGTFRTREDGSKITSTVHPSAVLRAPDEDREAMYAAFVDDLRKVAREMNG